MNANRRKWIWMAAALLIACNGFADTLPQIKGFEYKLQGERLGFPQVAYKFHIKNFGEDREFIFYKIICIDKDGFQVYSSTRNIKNMKLNEVRAVTGLITYSPDEHKKTDKIQVVLD